MTKKTNADEELEKFYEEKVPVLIRRPAGETADASLTVTLNGKNYQIMYDEEVFVPRKVKLILDEKIRNEKIAERRMSEIANKIRSLDGE